MSDPILYTTEGMKGQISVANQRLTTATHAPQKSTIKKSLTVQTKLNQTAITEECSVVQMREQRQSQWRTHHG